MKHIIYNMSVALGMGLVLASCSDFLDTKSPSYDSSTIFKTETGLKEGLTTAYQAQYMHGIFPNCGGRPAVTCTDNYTGLSAERAQNTTIGAGVGMNSNQSATGTWWSANYALIARAGTVIKGAEDVIDDMSDISKQYYSEARILRDYGYYNLTVAYGDVPFTENLFSITDKKKARTPRKEVIDFIIADLQDVAENGNLPWIAAERGRVDRSCAYGLLARVALFAAGVLDDNNNQYYQIAADAAKKVMDESGRDLADNFRTLFSKSGQNLADVRKEMIWELIYTDEIFNGVAMIHGTVFSNGPRQFCQTGHHPTGLLADTYECADGLRIDKSPLYNPKKPSTNRDPRFKLTLAMHGDTLRYLGTNGYSNYILEQYAKTTKIMNEFGSTEGRWFPCSNSDISDAAAWTSFFNNGCGYLWRKYMYDLEEPANATSFSIHVMRYAEILLTYAEAMIELGNFNDPSVINAINDVRTRAGQPAINSNGCVAGENLDGLSVQDKLRQRVRRERKCELAMEGVHMADMRRWKVGDLENHAPTYGTPNAATKFTGMAATDIPDYGWNSPRSDINDIADYSAYKDKLLMRDSQRHWKEHYYLWPLPQSQVDINPNLGQNPGYAI